jgi:hypothetical protein
VCVCVCVCVCVRARAYVCGLVREHLGFVNPDYVLGWKSTDVRPWGSELQFWSPPFSSIICYIAIHTYVTDLLDVFVTHNVVNRTHVHLLNSTSLSSSH